MDRSRTPVLASPDAADRPFKLDWLDSCYQETLLPGTPWHQLNKQLSDKLAECLEKQMGNPQRATVLAQILGPRFMSTYYPDIESGEEHISSVPREELGKLTSDANAWLRNQLLKVAKEIGALNDEEVEISAEMNLFIHHTNKVMLKGTNRLIYTEEMKAIDEEKSKQIEALEKQKELKVSESGSSQFFSLAPTRIQPIGLQNSLKQPIGAPSRQRHPIRLENARGSPRGSPQLQGIATPPKGDGNSSRRGTQASSVKTERVRASLFNLDGLKQPTNFFNNVKNPTAEAIVCILESSPRRYTAVVKRLHGRPLPSPLREYVWTETLYQPERLKLAETNQQGNVEKALREKFGKTVARNVGELKIPRASKSPIHRLIENAVVETYDTTPALAASRLGGMPREAIRVLNILYTYDKTYEPYLIHWLFPLQITYSKAEDIGPEHAYELAMHLDLLNSCFFPTWTQIFAIADHVIHLLHQHDPEFYDHLEAISRRNVNVQCQNFILELMKKEKAAADEMVKKPSKVVDRELEISDCRLYLRKWIGEGFVSVLDTPAVMLVWDQLFMQTWHTAVIKDFAFITLLLLRTRFMSASDHPEMREVFLNEPCRLLVADIQKAWLMLHENPNVDCSLVAACNRLNTPVQLEGTPPHSVPPPAPVTPSEASPVTKGELTPASLPRVTPKATPAFSVGGPPGGTPAAPSDRNEMFGDQPAPPSPSVGLPEELTTPPPPKATPPSVGSAYPVTPPNK